MPWKDDTVTMTIDIRIDDLTGHETRTLVGAHLAGMHDSSPAESVHALDVEKLRDPSVTFWSAWIGARQQAGGVGRSPTEQWTIAGIGALKSLDAERGELKSMRVADGFRGTGIGRALLRHIVAQARERGMTSLWLETGTTPDFAPAQRLYESEGFTVCGPFEGYTHDPFSMFMTRAL